MRVQRGMVAGFVLCACAVLVGACRSGSGGAKPAPQMKPIPATRQFEPPATRGLAVGGPFTAGGGQASTYSGKTQVTFEVDKDGKTPVVVVEPFPWERK